MQNEREAMHRRLKQASERQAKYYNQKHTQKVYKVGELVLLSMKNLKLRRPSVKLSPKFIGPFRIQEAIGTQAYRLWLPPTYRFHSVFHILYLEPYHTRKDDSAFTELPLGEIIEGAEEFTIEKIL